jgi:SAM-dependent methyltransferase
MNTESPFATHRVDWTPEKCVRFWDFASSRSPADRYFAAQAGDDVLKVAARRVSFADKKVLDFGCGPGFMVEKLLKRGARVHAADPSPDSLDQLRSRLATRAGFEGTTLLGDLPTPLGEASFDGALFLETIEHLSSDLLVSSLKELRRLIRPGGFLVVTVPNEEDLEADAVLCPDCGCIFHRVQHVSSWSTRSLSATLQSHGFDPTLCLATTFHLPSRMKWMRDWASRLGIGKKINLIAIAERRV